jgi:hypothetical protein
LFSDALSLYWNRKQGSLGCLTIVCVDAVSNRRFRVKRFVFV